MSSLLQNQKIVSEEIRELATKSIKKKKRKNQYTVEFIFGSDVDLSKHRQISNLIQYIPQYIPQETAFKLSSDIQIPFLVGNENQLGQLSIDPHTQNYKIVRYDKCENQHIFHFDIIDRPLTPMQVIKDLFSKQNSQLATVFENLHNTNLNCQNFPLSQEQVMKEFEKNIKGPYSVYIQKYQNGIITTKARAMNDQYLSLIGIDEAMIHDYVTTTGCLPWPYQKDQLRKWDQILIQLFSCNKFKGEIQGQAINYNETKFPVKLNLENFYIFMKKIIRFQYFNIFFINVMIDGLKRIQQEITSLIILIKNLIRLKVPILFVQEDVNTNLSESIQNYINLMNIPELQLQYIKMFQYQIIQKTFQLYTTFFIRFAVFQIKEISFFPQIKLHADARKLYLDQNGNVDYDKIAARWAELSKVKVGLGNKYFTPQVVEKAKTLPQQDQQRLLDLMLAGLTNEDSSVGICATRPEDYDFYSFYLEQLIRDYHQIQGETKQEHDWNIPVDEYVLTKINPSLEKVSMRARVARNVKGWNLPPSMDKDERLRFESKMVEAFEKFDIPGKYYSLTPGHKNEISEKEADELRAKHFLFNDMTTDNYLTASGVASDWPYGRGIWLSEDQTKMIWVGEEDLLRIISIVQGNDLGKVDKSLHDLLTGIEKSGLEFAEHPVYGVITTCPTNMGTGKRQSILGKFPNITKQGTDEKKLKEIAKSIGLQARGCGGEHSSMDKEGTADVSPSARFGVTEATVTKKLYEGLIKLYEIEAAAGKE